MLLLKLIWKDLIFAVYVCGQLYIELELEVRARVW